MKKIYNNYWFICFLFLSLASCNDDNVDEVFADSPADRIAQGNSELLNALLAQQNGFKAVYFTKNDEFGGFTFFMNFGADGTVAMTSDFDANTAIESSSYEVRLGTTTELVFTTRNHIQKVSNPDLPGLIGTGFKGTSVFQLFANEDGKLIFKDARNRDTATLILTPTNFSNFETESIASVEASLQNRDSFVNSSAVTSFPFMRIDDGTGNIKEYSLNYDGFRLFANPFTINDDGSISDLNFGLAFTEEGFTISPALDLGETKIEDFVLDQTSGSDYIAEVNNIKVKIGYGNVPVVPLDSYDFGTAHEVAVFNLAEMFKHSAPFNNFYENYTTNLAANPTLPGLEITNIILWELNTGGIPYIDIRTNYGNVFYDLDFTYDENTGIVIFSLTGATNAPGFFTDLLQPLLDVFILSSTGYYTVNSGTYQNFSNRTFSLINADNPSYKIDYWTF